jgi:hypothetical protein
MTQTILKQTASVLLLATGVFHLIVAAVGGAASELKIPLAVFGVVYFGLGIWTRMGARTAMLTTVLVTALGLALGGQNYLANGGPVTLPIMFVIDVLILAAAGLWLVKTRAPRKK